VGVLAVEEHAAGDEGHLSEEAGRVLLVGHDVDDGNHEVHEDWEVERRARVAHLRAGVRRVTPEEARRREEAEGREVAYNSMFMKSKLKAGDKVRGISQ